MALVPTKFQSFHVSINGAGYALFMDEVFAHRCIEAWMSGNAPLTAYNGVGVEDSREYLQIKLGKELGPKAIVSYSVPSPVRQ